MKITIFWTWYVWLVTGTCLAEVWHDVMCIDIDEKKVKDLEKWIIPIYEPGLEELVLRNHKEWRLNFSTDAKFWVEFASAIFSAVGTPPDENYKADLRFVKIVAKTVWKYMDEYKVFINKSTVPVGTWKICKNIIKQELDKRWVEFWFDVVSNPEFLREWTAIKDFMVPDRIVIWLKSKKAKKLMVELYSPFERNYVKIIYTDIKSAELIKYAANSFLATKLSFINEIANFAEIVWANIWDISRGLWSDNRIWDKFLHAGIWYGWSCFPKDVQALIESWKENDFEFKIIKATEEINEEQKVKVVDKLLKYLPDIKWKNIAIWGLSFKPKTDDIRDAPSIGVINTLLSLWVNEIRLFDPVSMNNMKKIFWNNKKVVFSESNYHALEKVEALIILTEWNEFRVVDFDKINQLMDWNIIIDWRNIWIKDDVEREGFIYEGVGK